MAGRFSLSFPGRRDHDDPWFRIGSLDVTTAVLVPALCVLSMFVWAVSPSLLDPFVLWAADVRGGQVWRVVTWPIANSPDVWTLLMLAMLWYFGRELERTIGRNRFAWLIALLAVAPGAVAVLAGLDLAGARPLEIAVFGLFCAQYPQVRFWGAVPAWVFGLVIIGIEVLQAVGYRNAGQLLVLFTSLLTAALAARSFGLLSDYAFIPRLGRAGSPTRRRPRASRRTAPSGPTVVAGPWEQPVGLTAAEQHELDTLLDKTNATGLDSLSRTDKARLNELSKKLRSR
ncbi:MAG: rhomboid family intramembrane serine protease [Ilumatobacteraceae bacterium]